MVIIDSLKTHWLLLMPSLVQFCGRSIQDLTFDLALVDSSSSSFSNACFASFAATFISYLPPPPHTIYCFLLSFLASFNIQPLAAGFGLLLAHRRVLCFMFMPVSSSSLSMRPYFFRTLKLCARLVYCNGKRERVDVVGGGRELNWQMKGHRRHHTTTYVGTPYSSSMIAADFYCSLHFANQFSLIYLSRTGKL